MYIITPLGELRKDYHCIQHYTNMGQRLTDLSDSILYQESYRSLRGPRFKIKCILLFINCLYKNDYLLDLHGLVLLQDGRSGGVSECIFDTIVILCTARDFHIFGMFWWKYYREIRDNRNLNWSTSSLLTHTVQFRQLSVVADHTVPLPIILVNNAMVQSTGTNNIGRDKYTMALNLNNGPVPTSVQLILWGGFQWVNTVQSYFNIILPPVHTDEQTTTDVWHP